MDLPPPLRRIFAALACALVAACGDGVETIMVGKPPVEDPSAMPRAPRLALVLSSGGPRGFAHVGVLKVLAEAGIRPDIVVGSSSGAFVGVLYAANPSPADLEARALALGGQTHVQPGEVGDPILDQRVIELAAIRRAFGGPPASVQQTLQVPPDTAFQLPDVLAARPHRHRLGRIVEQAVDDRTGQAALVVASSHLLRP